MVKFVIIRHGFSMGNKTKRFSGQMDVPLDSVGLSQAKSTAEYVLNKFKVDSVYSSDLCRAYDTVVPIADALGLKVVKKQKLREIDVGIWQGILVDDVRNKYAENFESYKTNPGCYKFEGGESFEELQLRAKTAIEEIADENDGKTVVIGTHGGVIRVLRTLWSGNQLEDMKDIPHVPNGSVTVVNFENGRAEFELIGFNLHLSNRTTEEGVK